MKGFTLTQNEIDSLRAAHRRSQDKRLADRLKAVVLLGTRWTAAATAGALLLDNDTVSRYVQKYQQGGIDCLLMMSYQGSLPKLANSPMQGSRQASSEKHVHACSGYCGLCGEYLLW